MANEARSINANSPNHLVETGNSSQTFAGKAAFSHQVINESGLRFLMAHHENGITRFNVEGTLQVVAGDKNTENSEDVIVISQNGNIDVVSVKGHTNVHATNICIQASKKIVIDAPEIQIGSSTLNGTKEIVLVAQDVSIKIGDNEPKSLGDALKVSNIFKAFSGSMVDIDKVLGINTKLG
jgi:hypothetical protein|tara:strand:+ start:778 stop:1320 length:543 start_codon:yes stop_codon:yes gene_type:complete